MSPSHGYPSLKVPVHLPAQSDQQTSDSWPYIEDELIVFGKHRGLRFSQLAQEDPEYIKWVLTNTGKSTYPQMMAMRAWLLARFEIFKPARSSPTMLINKKSGMVIAGPLKGQPVPVSARAEASGSTQASGPIQHDGKAETHPSWCQCPACAKKHGTGKLVSQVMADPNYVNALKQFKIDQSR